MSEAVELTKRLRLPYLRKAMAEVVPVKAQHWDPAEVVRILLADEAADRATQQPCAAVAKKAPVGGN